MNKTLKKRFYQCLYVNVESP